MIAWCVSLWSTMADTDLLISWSLYPNLHQSNANKQAKAQRDTGQTVEGGQTDTEGSSQDEAWYPREKVNYAKRKLEGANPCDITEWV